MSRRSPTYASVQSAASLAEETDGERVSTVSAMPGYSFSLGGRSSGSAFGSVPLSVSILGR